MTGSNRGPGALVSIVLPVFDEEKILPLLVDKLVATLDGARLDHELVFVNDGSRDASGRVLDELAAREPRIKVVHLARNFGQQPAVQAGLCHARGEAVVVMDADLQDDPEAIPRFVELWREGYDVVYAIRAGRRESLPKRALFALFYRILNRITVVPMPLDAGNFGLIDRRVAEAIRELPDRDRYYAGLRSWVGFRQTGTVVARQARYDQVPRVSLWGLVQLAKSAAFSFSKVPLSVFYLISFASMIVFAGLAAFVLYHKLVTGLAIPGWTSVMMTGSFFGALNALGIGILGEYVLRIYDQVRARPLFVVARTVNVPDARDGSAPPAAEPARHEVP